MVFNVPVRIGYLWRGPLNGNTDNRLTLCVCLEWDWILVNGLKHRDIHITTAEFEFTVI